MLAVRFSLLICAKFFDVLCAAKEEKKPKKECASKRQHFEAHMKLAKKKKKTKQIVISV